MVLSDISLGSCSPVAIRFHASVSPSSTRSSSTEIAALDNFRLLAISDPGVAVFYVAAT